MTKSKVLASSAWEELPPIAQQEIEKIISTCFPGQEVTFDTEVLDTCTDLCDVAEQVATAACELLDFPANIICKAAAKAAGKACKKAC
ncbi:hypothetical protein [Synechococcus sp. CS-1332]|uniref:hypothetical protein n=1 Tax=Synechococcus sp. CS-1332 TaxID=2847972 RepID=UPI00223B7DE6|nr:hypothetical protein [Synechococcus sp. CS-1332]MCT0208657.1 hypothetical protein [Synechococcus sp. CS-1332]